MGLRLQYEGRRLRTAETKLGGYETEIRKSQSPTGHSDHWSVRPGKVRERLLDRPDLKSDRLEAGIPAPSSVAGWKWHQHRLDGQLY